MLIKVDPAIIKSYLEDASNLKNGYAEKVAIPKDIGEISALLKEINPLKIPVTVSGAGTGQAGGRIPFGGIVLSTEKLNAIKELRKTKQGGYALAEAGVPIKELKEKCEENGLFYTYDPTEQLAFVGGTIATNASGARSFKFGPTRNYVKSLTLVMSDGAIFRLKRGEIRSKGRLLEFEAGTRRYKFNLPSYKMPRTKNSAGYYAEDNMDLLDLFIGQEGTLAVIAEVELLVLEKPKDFLSCFVFFKDEEAAQPFAESARDACPTAIEYFDENCVKLLCEKYKNIPAFAKAAIFFEDEIKKSEKEALDKWEEILASLNVPLDATWVAMSEKAKKDFLEKRYFIPERMSEMAKRSNFPKVSTDLAVPSDKLGEMLRFYKSRLGKFEFKRFIFGHIGDGHLHVNMLPVSEADFDSAKELQYEFAKKAVSLGGTVSAEHGIGKTRRELLVLLYGEKGVKEMFRVKKALDPNLILGRGNIFGPEFYG